MCTLSGAVFCCGKLWDMKQIFINHNNFQRSFYFIIVVTAQMLVPSKFFLNLQIYPNSRCPHTRYKLNIKILQVLNHTKSCHNLSLIKDKQHSNHQGPSK